MAQHPDHFLGLHPLRPPKHRLLQVRIPQTLVEPLTTEQVRLFLQTLSRYRDLCIVYLMLFCGLRSNEVLGLAMTDISVERVLSASVRKRKISHKFC